MRMLDLFAGICGVSLAAEWAGIETVAFCEIEPFPQKVIRKHWPGVPIFEDVRNLNRQILLDKGVIDDAGTRTIDIICAGYPCQPFSNAGQRRGEEDDRHLWPEVARLIKEIRPRWFIGENVAGHITLGLGNVLADLGGLSYSCETFVIPAAAVGSPQQRYRVFIVGYTEHNGHTSAAIRGSVDKAGNNDKEGQDETSEPPGAGRSKDNENVADTESDIEGRLPFGTGTKHAGFECSGKDVAHSARGGWRSRRTKQQGQQRKLRLIRSSSPYKVMAHSTGERCGEARASIERSKTRASGGGDSCQTMADAECFRQPGQREFIEPVNSAADQDGETSGTINDSIGAKRTIEPGLGRMPYGFSDWLDECRWPAGLGQPQHEWEPPRVASGIKNRVGRLKGLGNAVSPQQIYPVLYFIKQINDSLEVTTCSPKLYKT